MDPSSNQETRASSPEATPPEPSVPMETPPVTPAPEAAPATPPATEPESTKAKAPNYAVDALIGVLLIALVGGAVFAVNSYLKPKSTTTVATTKKDVQLLRIGLENPLPQNLYPKTTNDNSEYMLNLEVFEGLTTYEQQTKVVPLLATSWSNPDTSTWIFKIKPNVKFHDGNTLTSRQVKASLDQSKNYYSGKTLATTIKSVEVVDSLTVKIVTDGPDPLLANKLADLFIWDTDANKPGDASTGTGPYTVTQLTDKLISLKAVEPYHGGHVYTKNVNFIFTEDDTSAKALIAAKSLDMVQPNSPFTEAEAGGLKHQYIALNGVTHFVFNTLRKGSPLQSLKVRTALAQGFDRVAFLKATGRSNDTIVNQTIPPGIPGYDPSITGIAYDATAAKTAIVAAGYPKGFSLTLTYFPAADAQAQELKRQFALLGVTIKLDPESDQQTLIQKATGGGTDMYYNSIASSLLDGTDALSDFIDTPNYKNPALDALNDQANSTLDSAKRVQIMQNMSRVQAADHGDLPIHASEPNDLYVAANLHVVQDTQTESAIGSYLWKVYAE